MIRLGQAAILAAGMVLSSLVFAGQPQLEEFPVEEPAVVRLAAPTKLDPADERLFGRLQGRIDSRVEERMVSAMEEASGEKKTGVGTALALAVGKLVAKLVKAVIAAIVLSVLIALFWKYGAWLVGGFVLAVVMVAAPTGWLAGRK